MRQVGWWAPDEFRPEGMSDYQWESERIVTVGMMELEGGELSPEWKGKVIAVYVVEDD